MSKPVPLSTRAVVENKVALENTLSAHHPALPPVLSTPYMIAWMETACFLALEEFCEGDEITVGTAIHVEHRAPSPLGSVVTATAELERVEGRFYIMRVTARDQKQEIGSGTISRAFVSVSRFLQKTAAGS